MASALEQYFLDKKTGSKPEEILQENAAQELLGRQILKKHSPGFFVKLLDLLDRPGNATRALLVGKLGGLKGLIPFAQVIEDLTGIDIALNADERVAGTEVIEKFFGKQKQVKGKIDMVDVLGLLVEIVADPLWLIGGAGLTKLGKARKLVGSAMTAGKTKAEVLKNATRIVKAVHAAKAGKPLGTEASKQLARAIRTVAARKGPVRLRSLSWAKQVARGERATLNVLGRPVVKGQKLTAFAEKQVNKLRTGIIGEGFLSAPRRTTIEHGKVANIFIKRRGEEIAKAGKRTSKLAALKTTAHANIVKRTGLSIDEVGELAARHVEIKGGLKDLAEDYAKAQKSLSPEMDNLLARIKRLEDMKGEIEQKIGKASLKDFEKITGVSKMTDAMLRAEIAMGLDVHQVQRGIGYAPRRITAAMEKDIKSRRLRPFKRYDAAQGSVAAGAQRGRIQPWADKLRSEVVAEQKAAGFVEDVFDPDYLKGVEGRSRQHAETMAAARSIKEVIKKYGKPVKEGVVDPGYMSGKQITHKLHGNPAMVGLIDEGTQIPKDIARAIGGAFDVAGDARIAEGYWKLHEQGTKFMKGAFTVPFPAFHARNTITNKIQNWLEGAFNLRAYGDAMGLQVAAVKTRSIMKKALKQGDVIDFKTAARQVDWPMLDVGGRKVSGLDLFDMADQRGILGRTIGDVSPEELLGTSALDTQVKGLKKIAKGQDPVMKMARFVGGTIEDHDKLAHFLDKMKQGFNADDAAISAKKSLFDYNDLSTFEKKWLRDRFVFFYTFARKNLGLQTRHLVQSPGKQAVFSHIAGGTPVMQGEAKNYPDYYNERIIARTPFRNKEGNRLAIPGLGTPIEEAFGPLGGPGVGPVQRGRRILSRGLSRLNPIVLKPIEFATGQNVYFDKPITDYGRFGRQLLPTARLTSTISRLKDSPEPLGSKISGITTGLRYRPLEPLKQAEYHRRNVAKKFLEGKAPQFKRFFKPKGETVDPKIDLALQMQR